MQPTSVPTDEHIAAGTRRKWGERRDGESIVSAPPRLFTGQRAQSCCLKSSLTFEIPTSRGILLTVRGRKALGPIAGSGIDTMFEAITAFFGVMSAGIFIAHAVDGYRSRL
jgi:hypothetical protein